MVASSRRSIDMHDIPGNPRWSSYVLLRESIIRVELILYVLVSYVIVREQYQMDLSGRTCTLLSVRAHE
jgi:hypothetical protein